MKFSDIPYNPYSTFLKETFGQRVQKIAVHAGFTCPNRDGTVAYGGCTYCNIDSFTPEAAHARIPIKEQVRSRIDYGKTRYDIKAFMIYFQPYSNTYAPLEHLKQLYQEALEHPEVVGISVGTRPDCIDDEKLRLINRGHDYNCTKAGIQKTAGGGINVCAHVVLGFPYETKEQMLQTAEEISTLPLNFIKIHNLHIVRYTELAKEYSRKPFHIFTFKEWVDMVCRFLERLNPEFIIERVSGDAPKKLLIEPLWCRDSAKIIYAVQQELKRRNTYQGKLFQQPVLEPA